MFATDFPIQSYQDTLELVRALGLKPAEEKMLLCQNAERILPRRR
jgi:predicted TIM-barrel fold metal-dependent hydrolase